MKRSLYAQLAIMMFLQYVVNGSMLPIFSHYLLNYLHFEPEKIGIIMGMPALAALIAPAVAGQIADRYLSAERMLGLCHLIGGVLMYALSRQTEYGPFLWLYVAYSMLFVPTLALTNTVALHHVPSAKKDFARVRLWGTIGWVSIAWAFGFLWLGGENATERLADALKLSAVASWVLAAYTLTLPRSPHAGPPPPFAPWKAIRLFLRPSLLVLTACMFVSSIAMQFYYYGAGPYLSSLGVPNRALMPLLSAGQMAEVVAMAFLATLQVRFGFKALLIAGSLIQTARFTLFAFLPALPLTVLGIAGHGVYFALFFITAFIYLDTHSGATERARAQQFFNIIAFGIGAVLGFRLAGLIAQTLRSSLTGAVDYHYFWAVPAALALAVSITLALAFREEKPLV
ncbi:MAG: MFS transporter [FCB group bacterium]|jgi:nucleoside transporter|nr:MFS transporter [FCB group bacterium]